jgi:hypothetical protein
MLGGVMTKFSASMPDEVLAAADELARDRGLTRSGYLTSLVQQAQLREQLDRAVPDNFDEPALHAFIGMGLTAARAAR